MIVPFNMQRLSLLFTILLIGSFGLTTLSAQIDKPGEISMAPLVTGLTVNKVIYGGPEPGYFQLTGSSVWMEYKSGNSRLLGKYQELSRDRWTVNLRKPSGDEFQLDLRHKIVVSNGEMLYTITDVSAPSRSTRGEESGVTQDLSNAQVTRVRPTPADGTTNGPTLKLLTTASADKMNVLYVGIDNPITLNTSSTAAARVRVFGAGARITETGTNKYNIIASTPGEMTMYITQGEARFSQKFRVKRIPDPVAKIADKTGGWIGAASFKEQDGISAVLFDCDFDAVCTIVNFSLARIAIRSDRVPNLNRGAQFNARSRELINQARPGDTYLFTDIKVRCPGDVATREVNSIAFNIR
jgi:hypothetical protein